MKTNNKIKEIPDDFLLYYNDFIGDIEFADTFKHLAVNPDNPLVIEHMYHWLQHRLKTLVREVEVDSKMKAYEVLHKYALQTSSTEALDLIEAAQKEILDTPPITNNKN